MIRRALLVIVMAAATLWTLGLGFFGLVTLFIAPPLGLFALALAALPAVSLFGWWLSRMAELPDTPTPAAGALAGRLGGYRLEQMDTDALRQLLEGGLVTALDLSAPMASPGPRGPWMPVPVEQSRPPAIRPTDADGAVLPLLAEVGAVIAGPGPGQALRHMIAAYAPDIAAAVLQPGQDTGFAVFGEEVGSTQRLPDAYPVGEVHTTIRIVGSSGVVSHLVAWRRGPLMAHLAVSGDETLASLLLGHATKVADLHLQRLASQL